MSSLLRITLSAGSLVCELQWELQRGPWVLGAPAQPDERTIRRGRTFTLRLWAYENHGVPLFEMLPWGHQLELLFCYWTRIKLRIETIETLLWETWVWGGQGGNLVCLCEYGGWTAKGPRFQLRGCGCDCQCGSCMVIEGGVLSISCTLRYVRATPCTTAVLFLLSFSKEYFAALAECILPHSKSVTSK